MSAEATLRALRGKYEPPETWCIIVDARVTRRKYFHFVIDPQRRIAFRSRLLWECFDFIRAEDLDSVLLIHAEPRSNEAPVSASLT